MIFDAHLDLSLNAIEWNRDLTQPVAELRRREEGLTDKPDRGRGTVSLPEMRRGGIGLCVATQLARVEHKAYSPIFGWRSPAQAWAMAQAQLAWYRAMEEVGEMVQIRDRAGLERHLALWEVENNQRPTSNIEHPTQQLPIGYILSLEGADSLITPRHLERSVADGLRAIGPAHYGPGIYANGTDATGGFNARGRELLREIERLGLILDVTHLCDDCFWEALDLFNGPLWASHHNCRAIVPHNRQLSDEMIRALIERNAVIGAALDAWMVMPNWVRGKTKPETAGIMLRHVVDHIDHVCQFAGSAAHSGIGSDLDGTFGREQTAQDLDTIADVAGIADLLRQRGYSDGDVDKVMHGNFIRCLREAWH